MTLIADPQAAVDATQTITVLVVEDEALVRMNASGMLSSAGFNVCEAEGAEQALEQLRLNPEVSVLFSDINMPGAFDGLELARQVHMIRPDVHLILTSALARPSPSELSQGEFVAKPYNNSVVPDLINAALNRSARNIAAQ